MKSILLLLIRFYQNFLSFDTGILRILLPSNGTCRFSPRCSEYMYQAISKYGILKGVKLGLKRLSQCHPFGTPSSTIP